LDLGSGFPIAGLRNSKKDDAMRTTQQFSITLSNELAAMVKAKVSAGEYATESEVIRDGLRLVLARDRAVADWLRNAVAEDNVWEDTSSGIE
jgi:putative addiction module CopG family antidote